MSIQAINMCVNGDLDGIVHLYENGLVLNRVVMDDDNKQHHILFTACAYNHIHIVKYLIEVVKIPSNILVSLDQAIDYTPLMCALYNKNIDIARYLLTIEDDPFYTVDTYKQILFYIRTFEPKENYKKLLVPEITSALFRDTARLKCMNNSH